MKNSPATEVSIRNALVSDIGAMQSFIKASWARTYDPLIGEAERYKISEKKHSPDLFEREISSEKGVSVIAVTADGDVIGHVGGEITLSGVCFIDRVHVALQFHGSGVAARMMDLITAELRDKTDNMELTVLVNNDRAIGFYRKYGFVEVHQPDANAGLGGIPAVLMRYELP